MTAPAQGAACKSHGFMACWAAAGIVGQIRDQLRKRIRREMGRAPGAVATVIDSQSVKAVDTVGKDSRGYDALARKSTAAWQAGRSEEVDRDRPPPAPPRRPGHPIETGPEPAQVSALEGLLEPTVEL